MGNQRRRAGLAGIALLLAAPALAAPPTAPDARADFWKIIDRPRVPLDPVERPLPATAAYDQSHVTFTSEPGQPVPTLVMRPTGATGRLPVVIVLHGTGGTKEQNRGMMALLVKQGFLAVSIDGRYHGERSREGKGTATYYAAIAQAYRDGKSHPWLYDTVFDVTRLIDYLQTRPDVDATRIGLMGFSKGGMETYLTAAIDPRVAAAVPCISVQDFRWELDHDQWHHRIDTVKGGFDAAAQASGADPADPKFVQRFYDRLVPGIDGEFDCPKMLPLIAPRPLLAVSGELDPINPLPSAEIAVAAAKAAYTAAGVPERFTFTVEPKVGHDVKPQYRQQIAEWFAKQLGKPTTRQ